jgi:hypothetical protein
MSPYSIYPWKLQYLIIPDILNFSRPTHVRRRCALFARDGFVADEGQEYRGTAAIKEWIQKANAKYQPHADPTNLAHLNHKLVVTVQVSGTFPGSPAELHYRFTLKDDKIAKLTCD